MGMAFTRHQVDRSGLGKPRGGGRACWLEEKAVASSKGQPGTGWLKLKEEHREEKDVVEDFMEAIF